MSDPEDYFSSENSDTGEETGPFDLAAAIIKVDVEKEWKLPSKKGFMEPAVLSEADNVMVSGILLHGKDASFFKTLTTGTKKAKAANAKTRFGFVKNLIEANNKNVTTIKEGRDAMETLYPKYQQTRAQAVSLSKAFQETSKTNKKQKAQIESLERKLKAHGDTSKEHRESQKNLKKATDKIEKLEKQLAAANEKLHSLQFLVENGKLQLEYHKLDHESNQRQVEAQLTTAKHRHKLEQYEQKRTQNVLEKEDVRELVHSKRAKGANAARLRLGNVLGPPEQPASRSIVANKSSFMLGQQQQGHQMPVPRHGYEEHYYAQGGDEYDSYNPVVNQFPPRIHYAAPTIPRRYPQEHHYAQDSAGFRGGDGYDPYNPVANRFPPRLRDDAAASHQRHAQEHFSAQDSAGFSGDGYDSYNPVANEFSARTRGASAASHQHQRHAQEHYYAQDLTDFGGEAYHADASHFRDRTHDAPAAVPQGHAHTNRSAPPPIAFSNGPRPLQPIHQNLMASAPRFPSSSARQVPQDQSNSNHRTTTAVPGMFNSSSIRNEGMPAWGYTEHSGQLPYQTQPLSSRGQAMTSCAGDSNNTMHGGHGGAEDSSAVPTCYDENEFVSHDDVVGGNDDRYNKGEDSAPFQDDQESVRSYETTSRA